MMTPHETCASIEPRLDDYLDGALALHERAEIEGHLEGCAACRGTLDGLRQILTAAAALPRELAPQRPLWPAIASRLTGRGETARPRTPAWAWLSLAAALLVALSAVVVQRFPARPSPTTVVTGGEAIAAAETEYERAARELQAALEAQQDTLPLETKAAIQRNLAQIDQALGEVRQALRREPGNPAWARLLLSAQRQRVEVLTQARRLASAL